MPDKQPMSVLSQISAYRAGQPGGKMVGINPSTWQRTMWEDPQRVARYHEFIRSAPPESPVVQQLPVKEIKQAYEYLKFRNNDKPWKDWSMLDENDPGTGFLRNIPKPPAEFTLPDVTEYHPPAQPEPPAVEPFGDWDKLHPWQQLMLGIFSPQPGLAGRPEWTRYTAALGQGMLAVPGGLAIGAALGGPVGGAIGGGLALGGTAYQMLTGNQVPVMNELLQVFNLPSMGLMKGIGLAEQMKESGVEEVLADLPNAWKAAQLTYVTGNVDLVNVIARLAGDDPAKLNEVWQYARGLSEPQPLQGSQAVPGYGATRGPSALDEARTRIAAGEDPLMVYQEFNERFGDTGTFNDFILQTLLDPTPWVMWGGQKFGGKLIKQIPGMERFGYAIESGAGNPVINALPLGVQQLASWLTGKPGTEGIIASIDKYREWIVRNSLVDSLTSRPATELSSFDKWLGGLNERGQVKGVLPGEANSKTWFSFLNSMTDESKALTFLSMAQNNLNSLITLAEADPVQMVKLLKQAGSVDPTVVGQVGKAILDSPITATISQAVRDTLAEGWADTLLLRWQDSADKRTLLVGLSEKLGKKPADVLQMYVDDPEVLLRLIANTSGIEGDRAGLQAMFDTFTGDNKVPYQPDQFRHELMTTFFDKMDGWLVKRYGLKPDSAVLRLSQTLKSMQSLLLLGLNPAYFINNAVNNIATRAAVGVFGYMTPDQVKGYIERFGITPDRIAEAATPEGMVMNVAGNAIRQAKQGGDWIDSLHSVVNATNRKLGLFSRFSSLSEQMEGTNAYVIGMKRFWGQYWKRDAGGFQRMHPSLEALLDRQAPGVKELIYRVVEAGMNPQEIERGLLGDVIQPQLHGIIEDAAKAIDAQHPEGLIDMMRSSGVEDRLMRDLATAKTPDEISAVFLSVKRELNSLLDERHSQELIHKAEEIEGRVKKEGFKAVLELFNDLHTRIGLRWLKHFQELQGLFDKRSTMGREEFDAAIRAQDELDSAEWRRINDYELQTYAGIIRAIGMDNESARQFLQLLGESHANWRMFFDGWDETTAAGTVHHQGRRDLYREFFRTYKRGKKESWEEFQRRSGPAWDQLQARLLEMYNQHSRTENDLSGRMNDFFAKAWAEHTGKPEQTARQWRTQVETIRKQMQTRMVEFRNMIERAGLNAEERRVLWNEFLKEYNQMVVALKRAEIEGASQMADQPAAAVPGAEALQNAEAAMRPEPAPAQPGEGEINAALAGAEGRPVEANPQVVDLQNLARKYGIVYAKGEKRGQPLDKYFLNIINKRQPEGQKYASLDQVPLNVAEQAMQAHLQAHQGERAAEMAKLRLDVDAILHEADAKKREALVRAKGLMSRRLVRERFKAAFNAKPAEIEATLALMDQHAELMAARAGQTITDANRDQVRDAWYASHIGAILRGDELEQAGAVGITNFSSMSEDPVNNAMHAAMELYRAGNPAALKVLRWGIDQGIQHIRDILPEHTQKMDMCWGKFGGEEEPSIYFRTDVADNELPGMLYGLSRIGDESFHQWAVLVSRRAQEGAAYGPVTIQDVQGVIEPAVDLRFDHAITADEYRVIDEITNDIGIGGYTIMPDGQGIEIMRVSMYNGDVAPDDFSATLRTFTDRLERAGVRSQADHYAREVWLANADTTDPGIGAYAYADLENQVRAYDQDHPGLPLSADEIDQRIASHPYQPAQPPEDIAAILPRPELAQITPAQARTIDLPVEMPDDDYFLEAVENTEGAEITDEGLLIDLVRFQKSEQAGQPSVRTGVFYLPTHNLVGDTYKQEPTNPYGGPRKYQGKTLIKRPLVLQAETGGGAAMRAYTQLKGPDALSSLKQDLLRIAPQQWGLRPWGSPFETIQGVKAILFKYGGDPAMAEFIYRNSRQGNQLFFAVEENIVAHALREAGYDALVSYGEGDGETLGITEVFDVREIDYPSRKKPSRIHPSYPRTADYRKQYPLFTTEAELGQGGRRSHYLRMAEEIQEKGYIDYNAARKVFDGGTPEYLQGIVNFIKGQREKYNQGKMTLRDVAKAYLLTVSSQGSGELPVDTIIPAFKRAGVEFTRDGQPMDIRPYVVRVGEVDYLRPEDITGMWLLSDQGKRALDALEQTGEITPDWAQFLKARHTYGRFGNEPNPASPGDWWLTPGARYKLGAQGQHKSTSKYNLADIREITERINAAKGDPEQIGQIVQSMAGISTGKTGFLKHLLGFGDEITLDTQEANFWRETVPPEYQPLFQWGNWAQAEPEVKKMITDAFARLRSEGIGADIPDEAFMHIMHHWLWDLRKQQENRHVGMYEAQALAQRARRQELKPAHPTTAATTRFSPNDGRAVIRALNAPDVSSMVHEVGHIFRRELEGRDLDVMAKLGGLKDGAELQALQERFDTGMLTLDDPDRARYIQCEESFAVGWERYLAEGDAPTPALKSLFQRFTQWMTRIYRSLKETSGHVVGFERQADFYVGGQLIKLDAEIEGVKLRDIFDRLLVEERQQAAQAPDELAQRADWVRQLVHIHGTRTTIPKDSSYLTPDGQIVPVVFHASAAKAVAGPGVGISEFLTETGVVRVNYQGGIYYFEITREPTLEQSHIIAQAARGARVMVEFDKPRQKSRMFQAGNVDEVNSFLAGELAGEELAQGGGIHRSLFDQDQPVHPDELDGSEQADEALGLPDEVKAARVAATEGLKGPERAYAQALIKWLESGLEGDEPESTLPVKRGFAVREQVMKQSAALGEYGVRSKMAQPVGRVPQAGLVALRVHAFRHGETPIVAAVYLDGEPVAYIPEGGRVTRIDTSGGPARLLGMDPYTPYRWVIEQDGKITSIDPDDPLNGGQMGMYDPALGQQGQAQPEGEVPLGGTPASEPHAEALDENISETLRPFLDTLKERYQAAMNERPLRFSNLDTDTQSQVKGWLKGVKNDMASMKYAALGYGEQMRDASLLNYSKRYGMDQVLETIFPYQFWYTRSMINWAKRMIDRPTWYALYARLQDAQEKMRRNMPTRLNGKMRLPAPWMPDWAGGGMWFDPMSKLFPPETFGQPVMRAFQNQNQVTKNAESILRDMAESEQITQADYQQAMDTHAGPVWNQAVAQAQVESDQDTSPTSLVSMMMTPSLWWTSAANLIQGKPEKMSVLPITRTASAVETALKDTPLSGLGKAVGLAAWPEKKLRSAAGLSEFGQWGDWYIDRQLSNMAADGTLSPDEARLAMVQRSGPAFEQARSRVAYEQMLTTPGAATLGKLAGGQFGQAVESLPNTVFSGTLFPEGELKLRGLYDDYGKAWDAYRAGDDEAINTFFEDHPEYEARLALYAEPQERLSKFLINQVWDRYSQLDKPNRSLAVQILGKQFQDAFLNSQTRNYEAIDDETLARWCQMLGAAIPKTPETQAAVEAPSPEMKLYPPALVKNIEAYKKERDTRFPGATALQAQYYNYPEKSAQRKHFLARFPVLKQYWDWNRAYKQTHPEMQEYWNQNSGAAQPEQLSDQEIAQLDPVLLRQVMGYGLAGQSLSSGAVAALRQLAKARGMSEEDYARLILASMIPAQ